MNTTTFIPRVTVFRAAVAIAVSAVAVTAATTVIAVAPAAASTRPAITRLSTHSAPYWGGTTVQITGVNLSGVTGVRFGASSGWSMRTLSPTSLTVVVPWHNYGHVYARLVSASGLSPRASVAAFSFRRPRMSDKIQGFGLTGYQERTQSWQVRHSHHAVALARASAHWTPAMGRTAVRRAQSWLGLPYSWDGGNADGPTRGRCEHNGGDLDCRIVGFDCSGLTLYSWSPYKTLDHYSATQRYQAGRFHPTIGELEPGDLLYFGYGGGGIDHTAIYAGDGNVVQAPQSGELVETTPLADFLATPGVYRGATRPLTKHAQGAAPTLAVAPTVSVQGGRISIVGRNLGAATSVLVAGVRYFDFVKRTSGRLVLDVPGHAAGSVRVAVSNAWGTARTSLAYLAPPQLTSLSPSSGSTLGGTPITIHGHNLSSVVSATVGGAPALITVTSGSIATVVAPAHPAGPVSIVVTWPLGKSNPVTFTYVPATPAARRASARSEAAVRHGLARRQPQTT